MSGWVSVTGPPLAIWLRNSGITLPLEPSTLPKRTAMYSVWLRRAMYCTISSVMRLVAPITLVGLTALSVDSCTYCFTPYLSAQSATFSVPPTLFFTASAGLSSISGTCLCAAAWNTTSGRYCANTASSRFRSRMEPISTSAFSALPYFWRSS